MAKKMAFKIKFKKHKKSKGLAGIGEGFYYTILLNGKSIGLMSEGSAHNRRLRIQIRVKKVEINPEDGLSEWMWIFPKHNAITEEELKEEVIRLLPLVAEQYELYPLNLEK